MKIKWNCHRKSRKMSTIYRIQRANQRSFERSTDALSGENLHRRRRNVINVCHFGHDFSFVDTLRGHQHHARIRSIVRKRVRYKGYTGQRARSRNSVPLCEWNEASREKAQESREIFQTPEECPYNLQAGVENGDLRSPFQTNLRHTSLPMPCVYVRLRLC